MEIALGDCIKSATTFVPQFYFKPNIANSFKTFDVHTPKTLLYSRHVKSSKYQLRKYISVFSLDVLFLIFLIKHVFFSANYIKKKTLFENLPQ